MKILAVHQGAELYGSDRSFFLSISILRKKYPEATVEVILHEDGPLRKELEKIVIVRISKLSKLSKAALKRFNFSFVLYFIKNLLQIPKIRRYDILYINTIVILDFIFLCRFVKSQVKPIIHVREIQGGIVGQFFKWLLSFSNAYLIFNSRETMDSFYPQPSSNHFVVNNGVKGLANISSPTVDTLNILLLGRVNKWKGQDFFLEVMGEMIRRGHQDIKLRIVGSVFKSQEHILEELHALVETNNLKDHVAFFEFTDTIDSHLSWSNLVAVPSIKPEPFGRVAIEGMSASRPLIVADHGGLAGIVDHLVTGYKFKPGDVASAVAGLEYYLADKERIHTMGEAAKNAFKMKYSEEKYDQNFTEVIARIVD